MAETRRSKPRFCTRPVSAAYGLGLPSKYHLAAFQKRAFSVGVGPREFTMRYDCGLSLGRGLWGLNLFVISEITELRYNVLTYRFGNAISKSRALTLRSRPVGTAYLFMG